MLNLIFVIGLICLLTLSIVSYHQVNKLIAANKWVAHTYQVIQKTNSSLYKFLEIESQQRGYIATGDEHYLSDINQIKSNLKLDLKKLVNLTKDNAGQNKRVFQLIELISRRLDLLDQLIQLKQANKSGVDQSNNLFNKSQSASTRVKDLGHEIKSIEYVLLNERNEFALKNAKNTNGILIIGSLISVIFLILAFVLANTELSMRKRIEHNNKNFQNRLRKIIESTSDMIAAFDVDEKFIIFNDAYQREFKRLSGKTIAIGVRLDDVFSEGTPAQKKLIQTWKNSLNGTEEIKNVEFDIDNETNTYEMSSCFIQNDENEMIGTVQTVRNITKRIQDYMVLQKSYESLAKGMTELQNKNNQITLLVDMSDIMLACVSQDELTSVVSNYLQRLLDFASGYLYVMHPSKNYLEVATSWGNPNPQETIFTPDQCWAIKLGRRHHVGLLHNELICPHIKSFDEQSSSFLCLPLMAQNDIYGLLYMETKERSNQEFLFDENQRLLINAFAELTALALANVRLRENLRYQSIRDPLTGLYNRRYLDDFLFKQIHQAERSKSSIAILMMDLDHFKKINDTYGHDAGDAVLKELGKIFQNDIRLGDIAARYGGEEFIIMFYNADVEVALRRAESIRQAVTMLHIKYGAQEVGPITISIGVSTYPSDGKSPEELIEAADKALYYVKKNGKNKVALYSEIPSPHN
ncbi:diguanylate cyclase [Legionella maioricensis]|uniref:diguanylate cyclase n=1 Tax=Legionella maioricensis TaxID=2896528 RepID=A0A9X2D0U8_9GAMM|nr:diguanylate cyclase [Legionella maioricensis]MCL9684224.1 diguanylate cyclase [Legionella maioricensis]MCL9687090.1 diguanylate cyclase [Legionella maioricensis]